MKIEYQYFAENGFLISKPTGTITLKDLQNYTDELYNDKAIKSPFMEIVDLEHIDDFDFGYFEAEEVINLFKKLITLKGYKGACLVVENDMTKSMSNVISSAGRDFGVSITTFKTIEDACSYARFNHEL
jgi:hypothetical protein